MKEVSLFDAFNTRKEFSRTPETIITYQSRNDVREEGVLKIAKQLIALNLDCGIIQKAISLPIAEIFYKRNAALV